MAQLITTYSKELKEKIFILKGEEGYARTTDTLLEEILHNGERRSDWDAHKEYMLLEFRIDVLRDLGASQITIYDNDDVIGVYDFAVGTHTIEFKYNSPTNDTRLKLDYGVEHNIYARYMGNKQCLKSTSKKYSFYEPIPERFDSSISFSGLNTSYDTGDTVEFDAILSAYEVNNKSLNVYVDDVKIEDEITTDSTGTASISIPDLTDGKHSISVEFMGNEYSTATSKSKDISIGYIVSITNVPSYVINNEPVTLNVEIKDHLGHFATEQYPMSIYDDQDHKLSENVTIWNGHGEISDVVLTNQFRVGFAFPYAYDYSSDYYQTTIYNNVTVSMTANPLMVSINYSSTITGSLSNVTAPVKVSINQGIGDVMTDSNGNFTATYFGSSRGDTTVTASVYGSSASVIIEDLYQYWKAPSTIINRYYRVRDATLTDLSNGFRLSSSSMGGSALIFDIYPSTLIEFSVVSIDSLALAFYPDNYSSANTVPNVKAGAKIKIVVNQDSGSVYMDDVYVTTAQVSDDTIRFGVLGTGKSMTFDNLKLKRLS